MRSLTEHTDELKQCGDGHLNNWHRFCHTYILLTTVVCVVEGSWVKIFIRMEMWIETRKNSLWYTSLMVNSEPKLLALLGCRYFGLVSMTRFHTSRWSVLLYYIRTSLSLFLTLYGCHCLLLSILNRNCGTIVID